MPSLPHAALILCLEANPAEQFKEFAMTPVSYIHHQVLSRRLVMQYFDVLARLARQLF